MTNFLDITYLKNGNQRQQLAYSIISEIKILEILMPYDPIVVGTIPIEIDIPDSDLDIICHVTDFKSFQNLIHTHFSRYGEFNDKIDESRYLANFIVDKLEIEIYAENKPTTLQYAYQHMLIENRLLNLLGDFFREEIIKLKLQGYKTERAFGHLLGLEEPYTELLDLMNLTDKQLREFIDNLK